PRARACGAVNTVIRSGRRLLGDNTDGAGLLAALAERRFHPRGQIALIIGAGGSARSVAYALLEAGVTQLIVANRTLARRVEVVAALAQGRAPALGLEVLVDRDPLHRVGLVVNCTTTGLGIGTLPPLAFRHTRPGMLCCDLVYGRTP